MQWLETTRYRMGAPLAAGDRRNLLRGIVIPQIFIATIQGPQRLR
jgi:hypothetical protein